MFSTVVRARDTQWKEGGNEGENEVAIKVIRSQESMYVAFWSLDLLPSLVNWRPALTL